jgi:hypothetical protein
MTVGHELARSLVAGFDEDGLAAVGFALAEAVGSRQGGEMDETCVPGVPRGHLARAAADFERRGWLRSRGVGWSVPMGAMPPAVPAFLQGVAATRASMARAETSHAVITMPRAPSALAEALPTTGMAHASLLTTAEGMARVAVAARERLTVMTPFLNLDGLQFAAELFAQTIAKERKLILRRGTKTLQALAEGQNFLAGLGVQLLDYNLPCHGGYETFHAKIVLADEHHAYVGSANMLSYARGSVELGIVVRGRPARMIGSVVRAIEAIALPMAVP